MRSISVDCRSTTKIIIVYVRRIRIILTEQKNKLHKLLRSSLQKQQDLYSLLESSHYI